MFRRANDGIAKAARDTAEASGRPWAGEVVDPRSMEVKRHEGRLCDKCREAGACPTAGGSHCEPLSLTRVPARLPACPQASALLGPGMPRVDASVLSRWGLSPCLL